MAGVNVGMPSFDKDRFVCLRDEVWWHMRELFKAGKVRIPNDDVLKNQLTSIRYEVRSSKQIKVESKDKMKDRGLPSPDRADALGLALFASTAEDLVVAENSRTPVARDDEQPESFLDQMDSDVDASL